MAMAALAVGSMLATSCSSDSGDGPVVEKCIATGSQATTSFQFGNALARVLTENVPRTRWTVQQRQASTLNLDLLANDACTLAIVAGDAAATRIRSNSASAPPLALRALARLYDSTVQLVVPEDSDVRSVADLGEGRRVSIGARDSCTRYVAGQLLAAAGVAGSDVDERELDLNEALGALQSGAIEALFWSGEVPTPAIEAFSEARPVRLVDTDDLLPKLRARLGQAGRMYGPSMVPPKTYAQEVAAHSIAVPNYLMASADMDVQLARDITEQLFRNREQIASTAPIARAIDLQTAIATQPVELHRGAIQYYRDIKP
jgi:TRAP transporter TAXI family solute receptor